MGRNICNLRAVSVVSDHRCDCRRQGIFGIPYQFQGSRCILKQAEFSSIFQSNLGRYLSHELEPVVPVPLTTTHVGQVVLAPFDQLNQFNNLITTPPINNSLHSMHHIMPGEFQDNIFGLPTGFLHIHPTIEAAERCDTQLLPSIPTCPGPYMRLFPPRLVRPSTSHHFRMMQPQAFELYRAITAFGQPNYSGAKIVLNGSFPATLWEEELRGYHDQQVISFMKFGWPTGFMGSTMPQLNLQNHSSSLQHPAAVKEFLQKEIKLGGIMGPFVSSPFEWTRTNPLMARPKKDSDDFRIILDLSFPEDCSVNSSIPKILFEGSPFKLHLPTPLDLAEIIAKKGQYCYLYKVDLSRAYRQLPIDPYDWPLLGILWEEKFNVDLEIPFGLRHGAMACQRVTKVVYYVLKNKHQADASPYIDDFGGIAGQLKIEANNQYIALKTILLDLGLTVAWEKCVPPTQILTWTGTTFDTIRMIMWIETTKVEALELAKFYLEESSITLKQLEILLGKLIYASKLSNPAKRFLNRLLHFRRSISEKGKFLLTEGTKDDLKWFVKFLPSYNGRAIIRSRTAPTEFLYTDASLVGGGAFIADFAYFAVQWPEQFMEWGYSIAELEIYTILVAFREWMNHLSGVTVQIKSDNEATVISIKTGKTRNLFMVDCIREIWYICAIADIDILSHIPGKDNVIADMLSRCFSSESHAQSFSKFKATTNLMQTLVPNWKLTPPDS